MSVWAIHHGDCIDIMRTLAAESIDAVITSPPYAMQRKATYGGVPEAEYPAWTVAWMAEVRRVLKPTGSVVINITPHAAGGQLSDYVLRTRLAIRAADWLELDEMIWVKSHTLPSGAMHKPQRVWESLLWYALDKRPWTDPTADGNPAPRPVGASIQRVKAVRGWQHYGGAGKATEPKTARRRNVVTMSPGGYDRSSFPHPAPFNSDLAAWIARLICPPGGTILDPFNGSGSTGVAAIRGGWSYVGIDAVEEYVAMSRLRLGGAA